MYQKHKRERVCFDSQKKKEKKKKEKGVLLFVHSKYALLFFGESFNL